jgi:hypothetical protein
VDAYVHPAETAGWRRATTGTEMRPRGERAVRLFGAGAGWAGGLVAPSHGLGAGRNASFLAGGLLASLILGFLPMEHGFLGLCRLLCRGSGGSLVFVVTMERPARACCSRSRTERAESDCKTSCQQEFLHREDLIWSISNIWGGERLLYQGTVFLNTNRARTRGEEGDLRAGIGAGTPPWERRSRIANQPLNIVRKA